MRVSGDWLENDRTQKVLGLLTGAGHAAYAVGGCVRNAALGEVVTDVDIATSARPEQVIALAEAANLRAVPTGLAHGTVTLVVDGEGFEVTTFRRDVATDGRHAEVAFSDRMEDDAARRDFTMNALYADAAGHVLDPLGGMDDLRARRLRFVGDPAQRIAEDYLRILRLATPITGWTRTGWRPAPMGPRGWRGYPPNGSRASCANCCLRATPALRSRQCIMPVCWCACCQGQTRAAWPRWCIWTRACRRAGCGVWPCWAERPARCA